jgi:hypothetical protein
MYFFWHPALAGFMVPVVRTLGGVEAVHFPEHVRAFPAMFQTAEIVMTALFSFVLTVWAVFFMSDTLDGRKRRLVSYAGEVVILTPAIVVLALFFAAGTIAAPMALSRVSVMFEERPKAQFLLLLSALGAGFATTIALGYAPYFLRSAKGSALRAARASVEFAREHFGLTSLVVVCVFVPEKIVEFLASNSGALANSFRAGWVPWLLFLGIVIEALSSFFVFGALTSIARRSKEVES